MEAAEVAAVVGKMAERLLVDAEDDDDGSHEGITEESIAEVMRWLELEIKLAAGTVLALPPPARFVTASGNDESCGPAFSGPASTVMASVDRRPLTPIPPPVLPWPAPKAAAHKEEDDDHYEEGDYEWAMQLLNDGPGAEMLSGSQ
ncbi:hypothetical protein PR202_ga11524 [Eleusine coracana subsp. coracana]|uniref:Uncharacterized protein n=1 Tax=Eleusine coracana subsp. coracana TaxID=191504 RepID=A0AAV5C9N6_ELECO|nr:hypothetical protein PR202_ga11524 [Eleusine coracana subsp. coracana]